MKRFWVKVNKDGPTMPHMTTCCWEWIGGKVGEGYGTIMIDGLRQRAHRVAWFLETGEWPWPCALHICDNPACVRFSHLFEGTVAANNADKAAKGRAPVLGGSKCGLAKLTDSQVEEIRTRYTAGETQTALAAEFGIHQSNISLLVNNRTWKVDHAT